MAILPLKLKLKGDKEAKQGLKGVSGSVSSLTKSALKMGMAYFGAKGVLSGFQQSITLAGEQELQEKKLAQALGSSTKGLLEQASALQQVSTFGDEAIIQQQAFLASLDMTEGQIKEIIPVAMDLASATGMSLESAVRNTAKTFSGMAGELGELVPQLRDLTAEEMKSGEAVKIMADLFGGSALAQTQTFSGAVQQMKNALGDAGEELGFILTPALQEGAGWVKTFAENIGGMFEFLQKVDFKATAEALKSNIGGLISTIGEQWNLGFDFMVVSFKSIFGKILPIMGEILTKVIDALKSIASFIWEPIWVSLQHIGIKIQNGFTAIINGIKTVINELIEKVNLLNPFQDIPTIQLGDYVETESLTTKLSETGMAEGLSKLFANDQDIQNISDYQAKTSELWSNFFSGIVKMSDDTTSKQVEGQKAVGDASKKTKAIVKANEVDKQQTYATTLSGLRSQITGYLAQAMASGIAKEVGSKGLLGLATGTAVAIGLTSLFDQFIPSFAKGGSMFVSGKQLMMVGDNATGMERVTVDPIGTPSSNTSGSNITVNISAPLVDETVRDSILPSIQNALNLNLA